MQNKKNSFFFYAEVHLILLKDTIFFAIVPLTPLLLLFNSPLILKNIVFLSENVFLCVFLHQKLRIYDNENTKI